MLSTVTGRKLGIEDGAGLLDHYLPEVVTASDYYAFGQLMPGRSYENPDFSGTNDYRYAFNGKELDKSGEFGSLAHYDYGFRIYNPAIGKFLSVDPLTSSYPWYTPYQFAGNKPIRCVDLDGLEEFSKIEDLEQDRVHLTMLLPTIARNAMDGVENILGRGLEAVTTDNFEGKYIRKVLERQGLNVGSVSNDVLGSKFQLSVSSGELIVEPEPGAMGTLLNLGISALDVFALSGGISKGAGTTLLAISVKPMVANSVSDMLRALKINARKLEIIKDMKDLTGGGKFSEAEAYAAAIFEDVFQTTLKAADKYGDFIATSGKFNGKVIDHMGGHFPGLNNISHQISVLTKKLKTYDNVILDLTQYSENEAKQMINHISTFSKNEADKIVIIK